MSPFNFEFEDDDFLVPRPQQERTFGTRLKDFHSHFNSSIRAVFQDCLFRELETENKVIFQILCPNERVQKRLIQKRPKIAMELWNIWGDKINQLAICVQKDDLQCRVFSLKNYLIEEITD